MLIGDQWVNSLAPGKFEWNFSYLIFKIISVNDGWVISCKLALKWMSLDLTDDKSTLVQVMAWCRQATSHYLNQSWPRSLPPYGVTRPQWVNDELLLLLSNSNGLLGTFNPTYIMISRISWSLYLVTFIYLQIIAFQVLFEEITHMI